MRIPGHVRNSDFSVNMTPMIDVVFQLIIFFLVSSHLAKQEALLPLPLPVAGTGVDDLVDESPRLTINVQADGQLSVAGKATSLGELPNRLREKIAIDGEAVEVRIRSDRSVAYRHIEPILYACARSGIWNVKFAVFRPEDAH